MHVTYDPEADALYISLREVEHVRTREVGTGVHLKYADDGRLAGIELLDARELLDNPLDVRVELLSDIIPATKG